MKELVVEDKNDGKKLTTYLLGKFPKLTKNTLYKALRKKDIRINEKRVNDECIVNSGDIIKVFITDALLDNNIIIKPDIVYEDVNILAVNKPANLEVTR